MSGKTNAVDGTPQHGAAPSEPLTPIPTPTPAPAPTPNFPEPILIKKVPSKSSLETLLNSEIATNKKVGWTRLNKTEKVKKLNAFAKQYCEEQQLPQQNAVKKLQKYLKTKLEQKRLLAAKEVEYDPGAGVIKSIPMLCVVENNFLLKRADKRNSTLRSLAPIKKRGTIKNKN